MFRVPWIELGSRLNTIGVVLFAGVSRFVAVACRCHL